MYKAYQVYSGRARLRGRKIARLAFGQVVEQGIPATRFHGMAILHMSIKAMHACRERSVDSGYLIIQFTRGHHRLGKIVV